MDLAVLENRGFGTGAGPSPLSLRETGVRAHTNQRSIFDGDGDLGSEIADLAIDLTKGKSNGISADAPSLFARSASMHQAATCRDTAVQVIQKNATSKY